MYALNHNNLSHLIETIGYVGLFCIIFSETGLFFGFFFPGDSLLFISGLLASRGVFNVFILVPIIILAAFLGYGLGYIFGNKIGFYLKNKKDNRFYKREYLDHANDFYMKYGSSALVIGRFLPIIRTFIPIVAGMVSMPLLKYTTYNAWGACLWGGILILLGFSLGIFLPNPEAYLYPIVFGIIVLSLTPILYRFFIKIFFKR